MMAARRATEAAGRALVEEAQRWGGMRQTGVSLRYMMDFGSRPTERNVLLSAQFLHRELPIRIARRAVELDDLPFGLSDMPAILKVNEHPATPTLFGPSSLRVRCSSRVWFLGSDSGSGFWFGWRLVWILGCGFFVSGSLVSRWEEFSGTFRLPVSAEIFGSKIFTGLNG